MVPSKGSTYISPGNVIFIFVLEYIPTQIPWQVNSIFIIYLIIGFNVGVKKVYFIVFYVFILW